MNNKQENVDSLYQKVNELENKLENLLNSQVPNKQNLAIEVNGSLEINQMKILQVSCKQLINIYNDVPKVLLEYIVRVSLTEGSYRNRDKGLILFEEVPRGNYWIISTQEIGQDKHWLVPNGNINFNIFQTQSLRYLFKVEGENFNNLSEFILIEPATVILQPDGTEWKLEKKGILHVGETVSRSDLSLSKQVDNQKRNSKAVSNDLFAILEKIEIENNKYYQKNKQLFDEYDRQIHDQSQKIDSLKSLPTKLHRFPRTFLGLITIIALAIATLLYLDNRQSSRQISQLKTRINQLNTMVETSTRFVEQAVKVASPAVVRIDTDETAFQRSKQGSGFILSADGRLITNANVVENSKTVRVSLRDGQVYKGKVLGVDPFTDVAVLKIDANELPTVTLGNSEELIPGEWAIAIGNPQDLDNSVSVGIISAIGRFSSQLGIPDKRVQFIQTDAVINLGNSGGPLLNEKGEVIGINTAIRVDAQGFGFAIPIETAQRIANQLFAKGKADHPYVGIQMITLTPEIAQQNNKDPNSPFVIPEVEGVLVIRVLPNTPAQSAGIRRGDVIVDVDGTAITSANQLQTVVDNSELNQSLNFKIIRGDRQLELDVRTAQLESTS